MKKYIVLIFLLLLITIARSQEKSEVNNIAEINEMPLNTFTAGIGRAHDIAGEGELSNIGFDYLRRINPYWEWGVQLDLDWTKNFIKFEGVQVAGIIAYSITQAWPVFAGFGVANEEDHAHGFFRIGTEYTFFIDSRNRFFLAPGTFVDFTKGGATFSIMIVLGVTW